LDTEKGSKGRELQEKALARTEEKLSLSKMNLKEFRKEKFDQMKKEEQDKCTVIDKSIEEKETLLLQLRLESHYSLMMNFIRTKAEPTIFYLPAKHTKDTEQALEETRAALKHKIASIKVSVSEDGTARAKAAAAAEAAVEKPPPADKEEKGDAEAADEAKDEKKEKETEGEKKDEDDKASDKESNADASEKEKDKDEEKDASEKEDEKKDASEKEDEKKDKEEAGKSPKKRSSPEPEAADTKKAKKSKKTDKDSKSADSD
jgi:pinin